MTTCVYANSSWDQSYERYSILYGNSSFIFLFTLNFYFRAYPAYPIDTSVSVKFQEAKNPVADVPVSNCTTRGGVFLAARIEETDIETERTISLARNSKGIHSRSLVSIESCYSVNSNGKSLCARLHCSVIERVQVSKWSPPRSGYVISVI